MAEFLTQEKLKELFHYNPESGLFIRKVTITYNAKEGDIAGWVSDNGYVLINVKGQKYRAHRLVWLYMTGNWPKDRIDHKNGIRDDNRFSNLRECTQQENLRNKVGNRGETTSKYKGVYWDKSRRKWAAEAHINNKKIYLGRFENEEDAARAYDKFAVRNFGEFARGNF